MKTKFIVVIIIAVVILSTTAYLFDQMYDCLYPPHWLKTLPFSLDMCWELFLNGHLPDWLDVREDYAKKQRELIENE